MKKTNGDRLNGLLIPEHFAREIVRRNGGRISSYSKRTYGKLVKPPEPFDYDDPHQLKWYRARMDEFYGIPREAQTKMLRLKSRLKRELTRNEIRKVIEAVKAERHNAGNAV
jgi:hypothetical protein